MTQGARTIGELFRWSGKRTDVRAADEVAPPPADLVTKSKVFPRFLAAVSQQPTPVILDLGPVVGSNVAFFGERLACKLYVEDLYGEIEGHARRGDPEGLIDTFAARFTQAPGSIDGILCWDVFDFLDRAAGRALAGRLAALLRKGGALYGSFGTTPIDLDHYTRFVVESEDTLRHRQYAATPVKRLVLLTRDIIKMFDGLVVAESILLKSATRETLFRRP